MNTATSRMQNTSKTKSPSWISLPLTALFLLPLGCAEGVTGNGGNGILLQQERAIEGQYIVKLDETAIHMAGGGPEAGQELAQALAEDAGGRLISGLDGKQGVFAVELSEEGAEELSWDRRVAYVETDAVVTAAAVDSEPASWGLDRIDQQELPLDGSFDYGSGGEGVTVYVVDSGIMTDHVVFGGRAREGISVITDGHGAQDCDGHGTHVAGTAAGNAVGIARNADVVSVRVLDCAGDGSTSGIIMGVEWIIANAKLPAVINASHGGASSPAMVEAYEKATAAGITVVVASGNAGKDACDFSPANAPSAITVGASDKQDNVAGFSNGGACVDILAPGVEIYSASHNGLDKGRPDNGTSMASPHVAGVAALILGERPDATPAQVTEMILESATPDAISGLDDETVNLLLFSSLEDMGGDGGGDGGGDDGGGDDGGGDDGGGDDGGGDDGGGDDGGGDDGGGDDGGADDGGADDGGAEGDCLNSCTAAQNSCHGFGLGLDCEQLCGAGVGDAACFAGVQACVEMANCL